VAGAAEPLGVERALELAQARSGKLGGASAELTQKQEQVLATQGLGGPVVSVAALGYGYDVNRNVSLQPFASNLNNAIGSLPFPLPVPLPPIPESVPLSINRTGAIGFLNGVVPLYTGGRIEGLRGVAVGKAAEAQASQVQTRDEVQAQLLQRYFGVQASARLAAVREAARVGVGKHLETAQRMEGAGLIARVDRLQADVAYEGALRDASKAQHDLALARSALAAMVPEAAAAPLATPLFVDSGPLEPLDIYVARGEASHPGLAVVRAKRQQVEAANMVEDGVHKPSVLAFGIGQLASSKPDWMVGLALNWVLFDGIDRAAVVRSGHAAEMQVDEAERQARQDIALLVERNWRNTDQAKVKFLSLRADESLAREVLRLREKGLAEGLGTAVDVIDAQLNLARVQAEQAGAAYEYSQSLAALLGAVGELDQFPRRAAAADIQLR